MAMEITENLLCSLIPKCNNSIYNSSSTVTQSSAYSPMPRSECFFCRLFYLVVTPLIVLLGCIGNALCIKVFTRRRFQNQSASVYFACLSGADLLVLIFYVIPEWLAKQNFLPTAAKSWLDLQIMCQSLLFFSYSFRMVSVWMLVTSTVERYIGVRHPMLRRRICTKRSARRIIFILVTNSYALCLWKPFMHVTQRLNANVTACLPRPGANVELFVLDTAYAALLTVIPSAIIFVFNALIARHLLIVRRSRSCTNHDVVGHQFACLLLVVSSTFLLLTWPYYLIWIVSFVVKFRIRTGLTDSYLTIDGGDGIKQGQYGSAMTITKTIYYLTYSVNFFLYSYASTYFRKEMKRMFTVKMKRDKARRFYQHGSQEGPTERFNFTMSRPSSGGSTYAGLLDRYKKITIRRMPTMRKPTESAITGGGVGGGVSGVSGSVSVSGPSSSSQVVAAQMHNCRAIEEAN